jgi:integrase
MSIIRRDGRWVFDFDRWIDGRRYRRSKTLPAGYSRAQAEAYDRAESQALHAIAKGHVRPRYDIGAAVACYLRERAPELKNRASLEREIDATRDWWQGRPIDELHAVCAEYAADQHGALAPATIKNRISYLRAACRWAWKRHDMADADPGARVVAPTVRNARDVTIGRVDMIHLARACDDPGTRALIRIAFYSGLRVGEQYAAERLPGLFVLRDSSTKNGMPRIVPIHHKAASAARVPLRPRTQIDYYWRKARTAAGLEHVTLHDLRHAAASEMVNAGFDLGTVGAVLGHRSPASTKRYAHHGVQRLTDAVRSIGRKVPVLPKPKAAA